MIAHERLDSAPAPRATLIFAHGLGADGHDFAPLVPYLQQLGAPALEVLLPHAPVRPVTINGGARMRAWYDIRSFDRTVPEDRVGLDESRGAIEALIEHTRHRRGTHWPVLLGGFSQGAALTLHCGLRTAQPLAGLIALSGYLPLIADYPEALSADAGKRPIFVGHGSLDPVVPFALGQISAERLRSYSLAVEFRSYPFAHQVDLNEWSDLCRFIAQSIGSAER